MCGPATGSPEKAAAAAMSQEEAAVAAANAKLQEKLQERPVLLPGQTFESDEETQVPTDSVASDRSICGDHEFRRAFDARFTFTGTVLGKGCCGEVREAVCRHTDRTFAVKHYAKAKLTTMELKSMRAEAAVHRGLEHPNIVQFEDMLETETDAHLIVEKLGGGELFDRVKAQKRLSEVDVANVAVQVLKALAYLHKEGIVHRDIKLENLVYSRQAGDGDEIKLIDLGFASRLSEEGTLSGMCGTPQYVAPDILTGKPYNEKVDMWSTGCVVYIALTGKALFKGDQKQVMQDTLKGKLSYGQTFKKLPEDAQTFVRSLLSVDPKRRPSAAQALELPWLRRLVSADRRRLTPQVSWSQSIRSMVPTMPTFPALAMPSMPSMPAVPALPSLNMGRTTTELVPTGGLSPRMAIERVVSNCTGGDRKSADGD